MAREHAIAFDCAGEQLLGILALPEPARDTAVLVVVGGPQYRVGSHRQFVQLSRALAAQGYPVLRFDHRGMGDSGGEPRSFDALSADIGAAIDALERRLPGLRRTVLFGLCDGASAALLYLDDTRDARVQGLCLLNPWVRSDASLARARLKHYYLQRIAEPAFWRKLLRGGVGWARLRELAATVRDGRTAEPAAAAGQPGASQRPPYPQAMARAWRRFDGPSLLALSGKDLTAREFGDCIASSPHWRGLADRASVRRVELRGCDHTLSGPGAQAGFEQQMLDWLATWFSSRDAPTRDRPRPAP